MTNQSDPRPYALSSETVQGDPFPIGERKIVPLVQMTTYARRRVLVGTRRLTGHGAGFMYLKPIAIIERGPDGEHRIPIRDKTAQIIGGLLLAAFIIPLILMLAIHLMREH